MLRSVQCVCLFLVVFFFFKQKTAYEMRISDWSSDVCSSDLHTIRMIGLMLGGSMLPGMALAQEAAPQDAAAHDFADEIIVTAQKREQSLQDVPIVVTVVNAQLLQDAGEIGRAHF